MSKLPCLKADLNNITCKIACCISAEDNVDSQQELPKKEDTDKHQSASSYSLEKNVNDHHNMSDSELDDKLSSSHHSVKEDQKMPMR